MLGWDLTDFGSGDFARRGLFLFTMRNGAARRDAKPYAEKIMIDRPAYILDLMTAASSPEERAMMAFLLLTTAATLSISFSLTP